ncbi:MAG: glycosyltransferase family 4 protein [Patescibacteria group bacterium]
MKKMKILHTVEFYDPSVGGAQEVVKQISEHLVKIGHDVTVATTQLSDRKFKILNGVKIKEFKISGNRAFGLHGEVKKYIDFVVNSKFDVVMNYAAQQWATDSIIDKLTQIKAKKIFVPCGFSGLNIKEYKDYFTKMPTWLANYDALVFPAKNYQDYVFAKNHGLKNLIEINNAADFAKFNNKSLNIKEKIGIRKGNLTLLLVGSHSGAKGHREAINTLNILPHKRVSLIIVAKNESSNCSKKCINSEKKFNNSILRKIDHKQLFVKELTREETISLFSEADLFFFPSNVECAPLVIYEAIAAKLPFAATDVGNIKILVKKSGLGHVLASQKIKKGLTKLKVLPAAFQLNKIIKNLPTDKRNSIKEFSKNKAKYDWKIISKKYESLYKKLVNEK